MINDVLKPAHIESERMDISVEPTSVAPEI